MIGKPDTQRVKAAAQSRSRLLLIVLLTLLAAAGVAGGVTAGSGSYWGVTAQPSPSARATSWGSFGRALAAAAPYAYRINAGGPTYTDAAGRTWTADTGATGGSAVSAGTPISGADDVTIFTDARVGMTGYALPVPAAGTYVVTLSFAENAYRSTGRRVFSVTAEGRPFVTGLDLVAKAGFAKTYTVSRTVTTTGNAVRLGFAATIGAPTVSALEVTTVPGFVARVHAGGAAVVDPAGYLWSADTGNSGGTRSVFSTPVTGSEDASLFTTARTGMSSYSVQVPSPGRYEVRLLMAEQTYTATGQRVFAISGNGTTLVSGLDLYATAGGHRAYTVTRTVTVSGRLLTLTFPATVGNAVVSGIEVTTFAASSAGSSNGTVFGTPPPPTGPATPTTPAGPTLVNQTLPGKQVWAHIIPQGLPTFSKQPDGTDWYGELYPLDLVQGDYSTPPRPTTGMPRAQAAGLTGVEILQYSGNVGSDFVTDWMAQADPTWSDSNPDNNFSVAPCLAIGDSQDDAVRLVTQYAAAAAGHPSAARVNGKLVVYTWGSQDMSATGWANVRARLAAAGVSVFLVADLGEDALARPYSQRAAPMQALFPYFDASYTFDWTTANLWSDLIGFLNTNSRQYAGGMMPGYDRETCDDCPYYDASGTKVYRQQWEQNLTSGSNWQTISTWNDMVERTDVQADSSWNTTRSDITAFYSAIFRGIPFPKPSAQLYITTPEYVRPGDAPEAEGLVLNGSTSPVTVTTQLLDGAGQPYGAATSTTVAPGTAADATTPASLTVTSMPAGRFLRARSWTTDSNGNVLQTVTSAPIVVYGAADQPTPMLRRLYYSIPAYAALPGTVSLTLAGDPSVAPTTATVTAPTGTDVRFNEVLQNTRQVVQGFATSQLKASVPMAAREIIGQQVESASPHGFYVGRVIDSQERVGYSDPVYIP